MRLVLAVALVMVLGASVAGCGGKAKPLGGYTLVDLRTLPEEQLFYPNSEVISRLEYAGGNTVEGPRAAFSGYELGSQASAAEIEAFYAQQLQALGWGPARPADVFTSTAEEQATGWRKGDLVFRLAILRKDDPRNPPQLMKYNTAYWFTVMPNPVRK